MRGSVPKGQRRWKRVSDGREIKVHLETGKEGTPGRAAKDPESESEELDGIGASVGLKAGE